MTCADYNPLDGRCDQTGARCPDGCPDVPEERNDRGPDDCMECGVCPACVERTRAYYEAEEAQKA